MINIEKITAFWNKYSKREQLMLSITVIFILIIFIYNFVYLHIYNIRTAKLREIQEKKDTLVFMQQVIPFIKQNQVKSINSTDLMSFIQRDLKSPQFEKFSSQIDQVNGDDIEITFKRVPFNLFLAWLFKLNQKYQFTIKTLEAKNSSSTAGVCKLRVVLSHSDHRA